MGRCASWIWISTLTSAALFQFGLGLGFFHNFADPKSHPIIQLVLNLLLMMAMLDIARRSLRETSPRWKEGVLAAFVAGAFFSTSLDILKQLL